MFIANMIGLVMVREFSPIFTAIILAGREIMKEFLSDLKPVLPPRRSTG